MSGARFEIYPDRCCGCLPWDGELKSLPKPCKISFVVLGAMVAIGGLAATGLLFPHMGFFAYFPGIAGLVIAVPLLICGLKGLDHADVEVIEIPLLPDSKEASKEEKSFPSRNVSDEEVEEAIENYASKEGIDISQTLKQSVKKHLTPQGIDISKTLKKAVEQRHEQIKTLKHTESVKVFKSQSTHRVYTIDKYPDLIFKFSLENDKETKMRFGFISWGRQICEEDNLDALRIPAADKFTLTVNGTECLILVEESLPIGDANNEKQNYEKYSTQQLEKPIRQLTQFICETGFYDLEWRNIPLIETKEGELQIALIDLEVLVKADQAVDWGLFGHVDNPNELRGLIRCLQPDQAAIVIEEAKKHIDWTPEREAKAQKVIALRRKEIDEAAGL